MIEALLDHISEPYLMTATGALLGLIFGFAAYRSRFCLRAACVEVADGTFGPRLSIWLVAFLSALTAVAIARGIGTLDVVAARQLAATGSLSGALIGGLLFGVGMVLARGCASRLLVLSASGNLRAIVTGLVLTLTAQASLRGFLSPLREMLAGLWTVPGGAQRSLDAAVGLPIWAVALASGAALLGAFVFGLRRSAQRGALIGAAVVGLIVYGGWQLTYLIANASFEIVAVQSITFTGPSTDTLMALVNQRQITPAFGLGLVPGVFVGAFFAALSLGEARIQRFEPDTPMERYLVGGVLMGFGSMLAGGCAVGAGMSGGAILAVTAWVAIASMWIGAILMHLLLKTRAAIAPVPAE